MEKVILVGIEYQDNFKNFPESMEELQNLTETAQGVVVGELIQKRQTLDRRTLVGKGKLAELAALVESKDADMVIFNHEITARQARLIEDEVNTKVIDRVQLILDIFAMRAKSKEGQLQVELAQLNYLLPRLVGQGLTLSRLGGGIGTRGPGETKLETDRRHIRDKITAIKRELKETEEHRERSRQKRKDSSVFQIGLIGYTNAGKSTIMNLLTDTKTYAENQLFATLDPLTKKWPLPEGLETTLTDTVGFIQDLPTQLIEAFQSTLEESRSVDLLLHVVDSTSNNRSQQEKTVIELLDDLKMNRIPVLTVYNKADLLEDEDSFVPTLYPNCLISAYKESSKDILTEAIIKQMKEMFMPFELILESKDAYQINQMQKQVLVDDYEYIEENNTYLVKGYAPFESKWVRGEKEDELEF
ncbi:GTPase HflX [Vagococcus fluvialis]|uniref:GTPase HflX n=1 Tax=Vagococcus fluvialis TaxID=2738 RepID=UPI0014332B93|nr:GTPase HflX [Vagococcus fluvialis]NKC60207.1 GTPase HflX [Vagococcus fluvialis]NKD51015.1 GTPase HflX [Vagococcus fluvialis]